MAHLANVSKVRTHTTVRRARVLPRAGQIMVPVGRDVQPVHVVARGLAEDAYLVLRASDVLRVPADELEMYLLAEEGAVLEKGAPLLRKPAAFGRTKLYRSPADGTLVRVRDGCLILQVDDRVEEVRAMLSGRVVSIIPERGVVIETVGNLAQAAWDSGKSGFGRLLRTVNGADQPLRLDHIGPEATGAVYVSGLLEQAEVLESLQERDAKGLIAGSMPAALCRRARELKFPIFLTEGIGRHPMAEPIFELLQRSDGRNVSLLKASQHYRTQRAEIVIPLPDSGSVQQVENEEASLEAGALVRVFGLGDGTMLGRVSKVHVQPRPTEVGYMATGAEVSLANGRYIFVPHENLDLIG